MHYMCILEIEAEIKKRRPKANSDLECTLKIRDREKKRCQ